MGKDDPRGTLGVAIAASWPSFFFTTISMLGQSGHLPVTRRGGFFCCFTSIRHNTCSPQMLLIYRENFSRLRLQVSSSAPVLTPVYHVFSHSSGSNSKTASPYSSAGSRLRLGIASHIFVSSSTAICTEVAWAEMNSIPNWAFGLAEGAVSDVEPVVLAAVDV